MTNDLTNYDLDTPFLDDDGNDVLDQPLRPFRRRVVKTPKTSTVAKAFTVAAGCSRRA